MIETDILSKAICWDQSENGFFFKFKNKMIEMEIGNLEKPYLQYGLHFCSGLKTKYFDSVEEAFKFAENFYNQLWVIYENLPKLNWKKSDRHTLESKKDVYTYMIDNYNGDVCIDVAKGNCFDYEIRKCDFNWIKKAREYIDLFRTAQILLLPDEIERAKQRVLRLENRLIELQK